MIVSTWLIALTVIASGAPAAEQGTIDGLVVNGSRGASPLGGVEIVLRARRHGQFVPVANTTSDTQGRFAFENLPLGEDLQYLPGANQGEVHFPGPRIRLSADAPRVRVTLKVFDSIAHPSPLVLTEYEIEVRPREGAVTITESMRIDNPSATCYVGEAVKKDGRPATLRLGVSPDFVRATFDKEFFGRRFALIGGKLTTDIPWPPGVRHLKFTYVLAGDESQRNWQRALDLPCSKVRLTVYTNRTDEVRCNLPTAQVDQGSKIMFESAQTTLLPAGHTIQLQLKHLPLPMMAYGRWAALVLLAGLVAGTCLLMLRNRRRLKRTHPSVSRQHTASH